MKYAHVFKRIFMSFKKSFWLKLSFSGPALGHLDTIYFCGT